MLISTFCFSAMQSLVKYLPEIPILEHIFFRSVIGWLICIFYLRINKISIIGKNNKMLIFRGLVGSTSMFSFFFLLHRIPFGSSVAFKYLSPVFTSIFAVWLLNEKLKPLQWLYLGFAFCGILMLKGFDPRIGFLDLGVGLISAISGGLLFIIIRSIGDDDHHLVILHYFMFISATISGISSISNWVSPNLYQFGILLLIGIIGFVAQNFFTISIQQKDKVSYLSILRYTEAIYALIIGYFIFDETYTLLSLAGIIMIFLGIILTVRMKSKETEVIKIENLD